MSKPETPQTRTRRNRPIWCSQQIEQVPITELTLYGKRLRTHDDKSLARLAEAIADFGFVVPVVIDGVGGIVSGEARIEAARRLGLESVPAIRVDHLTPEQVRVYRIAENRLAELSSWNRDALRLEFAELAELQLEDALAFDLTITGFDTPEIDLLILHPEEQSASPCEVIEHPDRATVPVTRRGDLWQLGRHRLLCGDALDRETYAQLLGDDHGGGVRMVFTDPPYNVPVNGHVRSAKNGHREFAMASGEMSEDQFAIFLRPFLGRVLDALIPGGVAMVCMDWRHIDQVIVAGKSCGFDLINLCVWNKTNGGMGSLYRSKHELICLFRKPGAPHVNNVELGKHGRYRTNVWDYAGVNSFGAGRSADLADHPTVKPTALVADAILDVSRHGDIVLDAFGGSGSTLLAAETTGRVARLIELDPLYVDVAIRRWQAMTGQRAVHAVTGEAFDDRVQAAKADADGEASHVEA